MSNSRIVVRKLLKVVHRYITRASGNHLWQQYIIDELRRHQNTAEDPNKMQKFVAVAQEYVDLVESVHANKKLLESYDITTDKDTRQRELVEKTAKRVGLKIPDFPPNLSNRRQG